jgi:hypothetical protein
MEKTKIKEQIEQQLLLKRILELRLIFIEFKENGGTQGEAKKILDELMELYKEDEIKHDAILDLADYVYGWCVPPKRIW